MEKKRDPIAIATFYLTSCLVLSFKTFPWSGLFGLTTRLWMIRLQLSSAIRRARAYKPSGLNKYDKDKLATVHKSIIWWCRCKWSSRRKGYIFLSEFTLYFVLHSLPFFFGQNFQAGNHHTEKKYNDDDDDDDDVSKIKQAQFSTTNYCLHPVITRGHLHTTQMSMTSSKLKLSYSKFLRSGCPMNKDRISNSGR